MASLTITVPDAQAARVVAMMRATYFGIPGSDQMGDLAFVKAVIIDQVTKAVLGFEKASAEAAADSSVTPVTLT